MIDTLDALYRETTPGEWETRFYPRDTGKTIVTPAGSLVPLQNCLSSADICFIVEMRRHWPEIRDRLKAALLPEGSISLHEVWTQIRALDRDQFIEWLEAKMIYGERVPQARHSAPQQDTDA